MCGIAGVVPISLTADRAVEAVARMCRRMARRGPDADGLWCNAEMGCVMGHRRLSIIDLDARSNQPMHSEGGRFVIVYNGEIYNFRELRLELSGRGSVFRTESDTEVILALISRDGINAVNRLRGMFAFALWDNEARALYLVRDPYGIKPLYYSIAPLGIVFASQVKAIAASGLIASRPDAAALAGFFLWGSVQEPRTFYEAVTAVPPGSIVTLQDRELKSVARFNDIERVWDTGAPDESPRDLQEKVRGAVLDSVRSHLIADVPVSVFLSGGLDSSVVAGLIAELKHPIEAVTVGFQEFTGKPSDEVPAARAIARHYGISHHVRMVGQREFEHDLPIILDAMDQPSIDGVNTWFASKAVAERDFKVVLSGVGGDELFAGYSTFRTVPRLARLGRTFGSVRAARGCADALFGTTGRLWGKPKLAALFAPGGSPQGTYFLARGLFLPEELPEIIGRDLAEAGLQELGSPYRADNEPENHSPANWPACIAALESTRYLRNQLLRDSDWASMAHSLELRTPLVDHVLAKTLAPYTAAFMNGKGKRMLARSVAGGLPESIVGRSKTGFGLPMASWLSRMSTPATGCTKSKTESASRRWSRIVARHFVPSLAA